jgi:RHS repeat-associated protein
VSASAAGGDAGQGQYDESYTYNEIGNLTSKGGVTYTYPAAGSARPHAVTGTSNGGSFSHDDNGNMISRLVKGGDPTYTQTWDYDNRLASVTANSQTTTFTYDGNGALVKRVVSGQTTVYVGQHYEKNVTTGQISKYYFFGAQRVAMNKAGVLYYIAGDHLGTTSVVICGQQEGCDSFPLGGVVAESRHYPYGAERWSSGTFPTDYRFTGQRLDGLGIYAMGVRWYDPYINRWLSADTLVPDPANPQGFNRFAYGYNNPLRFVDPTGMFTEEELVELGVYTWEEIEALRGTDWYSLLMDPDAQIGASIYFGNGLADYTGPMGMGTFYLSEGKLFVGGDVALWNQDMGGYEGQKVWASAQQWGDLFEQASHQPDSYGLVSGLEEADYAVLNASFPVPGIPYPFGGTVSIIKDKDGYLYGGVGFSGGEAWPAGSVNLSWGYLENPETSVKDFVTGWSGYSNLGVLSGAGYVRSLSLNVAAIETGFYTPQVGGGLMYGFILPWSVPW